MTDPNIPTMRSLAEAASEGMWISDGSCVKQPYKHYSANGDTGDSSVTIARCDNKKISKQNAAFIAAANPKAVIGLLDEVERLERALAVAALCVLKPNIAIIDTVWMNDRTNTTLYEHLVSEIGVELSADVDADQKTLEEYAEIRRVKGEL